MDSRLVFLLLQDKIYLEITLRSDKKKGFELIPKRWVVERTFSWLGNARRLAKDFEKTTVSSQVFIYLSMTRLMLNRL